MVLEIWVTLRLIFAVEMDLISRAVWEGAVWSPTVRLARKRRPNASPSNSIIVYKTIFIYLFIHIRLRELRQKLTISSDRGSGCRLYQKLGCPRSRIAIYATAALLFFASLVKCFPDALGFSDCLYDEISIIPTKLNSNLVSKFLLEKKRANTILYPRLTGISFIISLNVGKNRIICRRCTIWFTLASLGYSSHTTPPRW